MWQSYLYASAVDNGYVGSAIASAETCTVATEFMGV